MIPMGLLIETSGYIYIYIYTCTWSLNDERGLHENAFIMRRRSGREAGSHYQRSVSRAVFAFAAVGAGA